MPRFFELLACVSLGGRAKREEGWLGLMGWIGQWAVVVLLRSRCVDFSCMCQGIIFFGQVHARSRPKNCLALAKLYRRPTSCLLCLAFRRQLSPWVIVLRLAAS